MSRSGLLDIFEVFRCEQTAQTLGSNSGTLTSGPVDVKMYHPGMYLWTFVRAFSEDWKAIMSGVGSIVLAFLAVFFPPSDNGKKLLLSASAMCFVAASYRIWEAEHRRALEEQNKRSRPVVTVDCFIAQGFPDFRLSNASDELAVNVRIHNLERNGKFMMFGPIPRISKGEVEYVEFHIDGAGREAHSLDGFKALLGDKDVRLPVLVSYSDIDGREFLATHELEWSHGRVDVRFVPPLTERTRRS